MLEISANINRVDWIGEIWIQRIRGIEHGLCEYMIIKPEGFEVKTISHHYDQGWTRLLEKALKIINDSEYGMFRNAKMVNDSSTTK